MKLFFKDPILYIRSRVFNSRRARYRLWLKTERPSSKELPAIREEISSFKNPPLISIVVPVYNTPPKYLRAAVDSVRAQLYPHWELCIADDASTDRETQACLDEIEKSDEKLKIVRRDVNGHISLASNSALEIATGEFVGLLDHDDLLEPHALLEVVRTIYANPNADMIYSDEGKCDVKNRPSNPGLKPDWSPDFLMSQMYICHFAVYRRSLLEKIGGFRAGYEGSQDFDLALRASEHARDVVHIRKVLYHWRMIPGSAAISFEQKPYAYVAARRALSDALVRRGIEGHVRYGPGFGTYSVIRKIDKSKTVGIALGVPKGGMGSATLSVPSMVNGPYPIKSVAIVSEEEVPQNIGRWPIDAELPEVEMPKVFRIEQKDGKLGPAFNKAAEALDTDIVIFLRFPVRPLDEGRWLNSIIAHVGRKEVAVVGGRMIRGGYKLWHAGTVVRPDGTLWYPHRKDLYKDAGHLSMLLVTRNCTALSWDGMAMRRSVFEELGGFDEGEMAEFYGDVDFCVKALEKGYLNVFTPDCELRYITDIYLKPEKNEAQKKAFVEKWKDKLGHDRYFSPHMKLKKKDQGKPVIAF